MRGGMEHPLLLKCEIGALCSIVLSTHAVFLRKQNIGFFAEKANNAKLKFEKISHKNGKKFPT